MLISSLHEACVDETWKVHGLLCIVPPRHDKSSLASPLQVRIRSTGCVDLLSDIMVGHFMM